MQRPIRVVINTPAGLQREILSGVIRQDDQMAVVESAAEDTADVIIVSHVRDVRRRDSLGRGEKVIAIDDHDQRVDLYEIRPLGQAVRAADLTAVIRTLARPALPSAFRTRLARRLRALLTSFTWRAS